MQGEDRRQQAIVTEPGAGATAVMTLAEAGR